MTHIVWGYLVARTASRSPGYLALGMAMGVFLDIDAIIPGLTHHGWLHSPVFVAFVSITLGGASRDRTVLVVTFLAMMSHLVLDSVAVTGGMMWLWPISAEVYAIWPMDTMASMTVARVFLFVTPAYWIWDRWKRTGEGPMEALRWVSTCVTRPVTWGTVSTFAMMMVLVVGQRCIAIVVG